MTDQTSTNSFPEVPAKAAPTTIALWPEAAKAYETMTKAAEVVGSVKGSVGEFLAKAKAAVLDKEDGKYVAELVEAFRKAADDGEKFLAEKAQGIASESMKDLTPKREQAEKKYAEAAADFDAAVNFLAKDKAAAKVLATVTRPTLPKAAKGSASGGTSKVSNARMRYYRIKDGEKTLQPDSQNSTSSLAYYFAGCLEDKPKGSKGILANWAKAKGVDIDSAEAWSIELPSGVTIGGDPIAAE